jgi:putative transposase
MGGGVADGVVQPYPRSKAARLQENPGEKDMGRISIMDSQSTRSSPQGGASGFDAAKKIKGRKRHLVVDTLGLLLAVNVTVASLQEFDHAS